MQTMMVEDGNGVRAATAAEVAEAAGHFAREALNRERPQVERARDVVEHLRGIYAGRDAEAFGVLFLDARHRVIAFEELFHGTVDGAAVHPREVAKQCLWRGATSVVLAHNHPSGVADPSSADLLITRRLKEALALLEVTVLDHIVVGGTGRWVSMAEAGLM